MARRTSRKPSPAELERYAAERAAFQERCEAFEADATAEELDAIAARFPHYSPRNALMIHLQMPAATEVHAYRQWQALGRQVAKGQAGIRIWAPNGKAADEVNAAGEVKKEGRQFFKLISVFDVSQTEELGAREPATNEAA